MQESEARYKYIKRRKQIKRGFEMWYLIATGVGIIVLVIIYLIARKACPRNNLRPELETEDVRLEQFDSIALDLGISKKFDDAKTAVAEFDFNRLKKQSFLNTERYKESLSNAGEALFEGATNLKSKISSTVFGIDLANVKGSVLSRIIGLQSDHLGTDEERTPFRDSEQQLKQKQTHIEVSVPETVTVKKKDMWDEWGSIADKKDAAVDTILKANREALSTGGGGFTKPLDLINTVHFRPSHPILKPV